VPLPRPTQRFTLLFHSVEVSFCPAGLERSLCILSLREALVLLVPRRPVCGFASPQPLRPHAPEPATGQPDPRRGPTAFAKGRAAVSPARLARPVPASSGVIGHPRHQRIECPPAGPRSSPWERLPAATVPSAPAGQTIPQALRETPSRDAGFLRRCAVPETAADHHEPRGRRVHQQVSRGTRRCTGGPSSAP